MFKSVVGVFVQDYPSVLQSIYFPYKTCTLDPTVTSCALYFKQLFSLMTGGIFVCSGVLYSTWEHIIGWQCLMPHMTYLQINKFLYVFYWNIHEMCVWKSSWIETKEVKIYQNEIE